MASLKAANTLFLPRRGADGYYSLLVYRPNKPSIITGSNEEEVREELNDGADVVVSLRTRSIYISPKLKPVADREVSYCGCAPNSRECKCFWIDMGVPPKDGRMIDDDHPEMQNNILAETCTVGNPESAAESNYQRVMENHRWHNELQEPTRVIPGEELTLAEAMECQDCGAFVIRRTLTGWNQKTLDAYFIRTEIDGTACWIEAHSGGLLPCSSGQHGYWITRQAS